MGNITRLLHVHNKPSSRGEHWKLVRFEKSANMVMFSCWKTLWIHGSDFSIANYTKDILVRNRDILSSICSDETHYSNIKQWTTAYPVCYKDDAGSSEGILNRELAHAGLCLLTWPCEFPRYFEIEPCQKWCTGTSRYVPQCSLLCFGNS